MPATPEAQLDASVVVATRDRPGDLARLLRALERQETSRRVEVVIVDDGSDPPVRPEDVTGVPGARLVTGEGRGPAVARNLGTAAARGRIVVFTDDDTEPAPGWLEAACSFLESHPSHVGVEGPVSSPEFDPLYEHSLSNHRPGAYWTCNMAYRRATLERLGGFSVDFPTPHCEDLDLAYRAAELGELGYAEGMAIIHHPRSLTLGDLVRRGRMTGSEAVLFARHRDRFGRAARLPAPLFPISSALTFWVRAAAREGSRLRSPTRAARFALAALGYLAFTVAAAARVAVHGAGVPR